MPQRETHKEEKELTNAQINLRRFRGFVGLSAVELDDAVGVKRGRTGDYEGGKAIPPEEYLREAANKFGIKDWTLLHRKLELSLLLNAMEDPEPYMVPYWGVVPCGNWELPGHDEGLAPVSSALKGRTDIIAVKATGGSMTPLYQPGQIIPIRKTKNKVEGVVSLIMNEDNELSLKVARRFQGGDWEFHSINALYGQVKGTEVTLIGHAVHVPENFDLDGVRI